MSRRAVVSVLARRRVSAWALPRPSATASARLAKTAVSQSQTVIAQPKTLGSAIAATVVTAEPTSTTNMTGLRTMTRGSSLRTASGRDETSSLGSSSPAETLRGAASPPPSTGAGVRVDDISGDLPRAAREPGPGSR